MAAPAEVYAVELDSEILEEAQRYIAKGGAANCTFIAYEARNLPDYVPKRVSYVLLANIFHGIPDKVGISRAVHEVLRPQGKFGIMNWHATPKEQTQILDESRSPATQMRLSPEQTRVLVEPARFQLERVVELTPYQYGAIFTKK